MSYKIHESLLAEVTKIVLTEDLHPQDLETKLKETFKKQFPYGELFLKKSSLGNDTLFFTITMLSKADWPHNIRENDPIHTMFRIQDLGNDQLEVSLITGGGVSLVPPEDKKRFYAMVPFKVPFRKKNGNEDKIITALSTYFTNLKQAVIHFKNEIYGKERIDDKYFK